MSKIILTLADDVSSPEIVNKPALPGPMDCYIFQRCLVEQLNGEMLNAASGPDPAQLGNLGAINMDIQKYEENTKTDFTTRGGRFVHGSVTEMPFESSRFDVVILGEYLEHCEKKVAIRSIEECSRVLVEGGVLILTVPSDGHSVAKKQRGAWEVDPRGAYTDGTWHEHISFWFEEDFRDMRRAGHFAEVLRCELFYHGDPFANLNPMGGWGFVWRKRTVQ